MQINAVSLGLITPDQNEKLQLLPSKGKRSMSFTHKKDNLFLCENESQIFFT